MNTSISTLLESKGRNVCTVPSNVTVADAVAVHPPLPVAVTVYVPELFTVIAAVVCPPGLHEYEFPPLAVSVVVCPWQIVRLPLMPGVGAEFTVTVTETILSQPFTLTVHLYVVVEGGLTVIELVVGPVSQA